MASKDKDYRLITLITDICPLPLRKFFLNLAQSDASPGVPFTTLDTYMTFRKLDVEKLVKLPPKSIRKDQFNLIYPNADETKWDVSLLSSLLLGLFGRQMLNGEDQLIKIIREIRNKRQHKPGNIVTEDSEFDTVWNDIETATLTLAQIVGGRTYEDEVRSLIEDVKINNLPRLGDTLKTWYEDIIVQLRSEIEELKDTSNRSLRILEATTVKRKSSSGGKSKRQKIDDPVLKKLRGHFEQTLSRELPEDFEPHEEEGAVRRKLQDNHYVVVSGHENTSYLATVLSAIKSSGNYLMSRCVEIKKLDEWRHVDPEETDLVIYCEPFHDRVVIDDPRSRRVLCDTFQSMQDSAKMSDKESRVDVVIVSERSMVVAWKEHSDMQLFEDVVELHRPTDKDNIETPLSCLSTENKNSDGLLSNMPGTSGRVLPFKCPWENVGTAEEAQALINDGVLPNERGLSELVHRLGRKSDIVQLLCKHICEKIESASPAFIHAFAAYTLANREKLHFVVLLENESSSDLTLDYEILFRSGKGDEKTEHKYMTNKSEGELLADESTAVKYTINTISKQYMENHKYLSAITARKICLEGRENICILMYVHPCTGRYSSIPHTEEPLPTEIQGYKVVVCNGVFKTATKAATEYHDNLRMGCQITSNLVNGFGTLGGFIDHYEYGLCGFTCAHVVCNSEQMIELKRAKRLKWSTSKDPCLVYQPSRTFKPVGRVVKTVYTEGDSGSAGVDLALFQIEDRPPVSGTSPCCSSNGKLQYVNGKTWGRSRITESTREVQKFGVETGITQGIVWFDGMSVRELSFVTKLALHGVDTILYNQYEIVNASGHFCEQGDSGGLVFMKDCTNELICIGMVNGVLDTVSPFHGVVTPITEILRELNVQNLKPFREELTLDNLEKKVSAHTEVILQREFQTMQSRIRESVSTVAQDMFAEMMKQVQTTIKSEVQSSMSQMHKLLQEKTSDSNIKTDMSYCDDRH